jgi:hypothetical protein
MTANSEHAACTHSDAPLALAPHLSQTSWPAWHTPEYIALTSTLTIWLPNVLAGISCSESESQQSTLSTQVPLLSQAGLRSAESRYQQPKFFGGDLPSTGHLIILLKLHMLPI